MAQQYTKLGIFSDWVDEARRQGPLFPEAAPGPETQRRVREALGFCTGPEAPQDVRVEAHWSAPAWRARRFRGRSATGHAPTPTCSNPRGPGRLPGVIALHDHSAFKFYGKEKIADGPADPPPVLTAHRSTYYGGRASRTRWRGKAS